MFGPGGNTPYTPYVAPASNWQTSVAPVSNANLQTNQGPAVHSAALAGAGVQAGYGAYGGVPFAANPQATQAASIGGNISNLPGLQNLASNVNQFQQNQLNAQYSGLNPNFAGSYGQAGTNIAQQLRGEVPADVVRQLQQNAAEFGVRGGISGSALQGYQGLRALGLTSLGQQQQGQNNLLSLTAGTPIAHPYDIAQGFVSPDQQQAAQQHANNLAAAPNPGQSAANALALAQQGQRQGGGGVSMGTPSLGAGKPASQNTLGDIISRYSGGGSQGGAGTGKGNSYDYYNPSDKVVNDWWNNQNEGSSIASGSDYYGGGSSNYGADTQAQWSPNVGMSGFDYGGNNNYGLDYGSGYGPSYGYGSGVADTSYKNAAGSWNPMDVDWSQYE